MAYDATPRQKRTIALLCMALGIKEHLEERPMSKGEAGRLIRELQDQLALKRAREAREKADKIIGGKHGVEGTQTNSTK